MSDLILKEEFEHKHRNLKYICTLPVGSDIQIIFDGCHYYMYSWTPERHGGQQRAYSFLCDTMEQVDAFLAKVKKVNGLN